MPKNIFYPIHDIIPDDNSHGMIVGTNGALTYVVKLEVPEVYSSHKGEIEKRHSAYVQAFSHMPPGSYVHKQDVFRKCRYQGHSLGNSYLSQADAAHFSGREYLKHTCVLAFSLSGLKTLATSYMTSILSYKQSLKEEDLERLADFLSAVEFAISNLSAMADTKVSFLTTDELREYVFSSANFYETKGITDAHFEQQITAGQYKGRIYAITDEEFFSDSEYPVATKDYSVSRDKSELYMSPAEAFAGIHLNKNHVYNQILYFHSDKLLKEQLRKSLDDHIVNKGWDKVNIPHKIKELESLTKEINEHKELLCYAHYNIMIWETGDDKLEQAEKEVRAAMDTCNINYYIPGYENLAEIYAAGIIGAAPSLPKGYMFMTALSLGSLFFTHYTAFKNDDDGILFNDRLSQMPIKKDIWDAKNNRIKARNAVVVAPTGSGKSFITNNIIHQLLDKGFTIVAVEFGNSFKQLCNLYPDISLHVEYDQYQPLGINPFDIGGTSLTPDKEDTLVSLCLRFWRKPSADANLTVALRKLIESYYATIHSGHSFQDFYRFISANYAEIFKEYNIKEEYFDVASFKHVCSEFMPGGAYANLCSSDGIGAELSQKRFVHFELTKVKASPFVASIVMSLLFDVINNKILSDPSKRGYIIFDEYAETAQMKASSSLDVDIHQTVAFFYQKIRKENGAVMTIIQSPVQLPDNEYTKGIIANTQLLYVLEGTEVVYDAIIDTFRIRNAAHIAQMKSIKNNYNSTHPYSECWIRFGESYALTVRVEASKRKYLAFQTQGEIRATLDDLYEHNGHDMQAAIEEYINQ